MKRRRSVSLLVQTDGALESRRFQMSLWALRAGMVLLLGVVVLLLLAIAF